ncbi:MAG: signal peptide peptidase SppA [Myxococcales bacterium]|nr:signal peptide peptidase SppA [Myxococcales bacterium]
MRALRIALVVLSLLLAWSASGAAQLHRATDPVATPASSIVALDDALALDQNPAALAMLPSWSLAYLHAELDRSDAWLARGDALYFASPVFGPLAIGTTIQSIRPEGGAARPLATGGDVDRAMGAFSLALGGDRFSFGLTTRGFSSGNSRFDGLGAVDVGMLLRPSSRLSASLVARDLFVSREGFGTGGLDLGSSFLLGLGIRPFGTEALTLDLAVAADADALDRLSGRGGVSLAIPQVGMVSGLIEAVELDDDDPALRLVAELAINMGHATLAAGVMDGDGFNDAGWYSLVRAEGRPRAGMAPPVRVLEMELRGLSSRGILGAALVLDRARTDPRIGGVLLRPRGSGVGFAYAQELRLLIKALRDAGKPVVCHLESASGAEFYACASADRILIDPAGDVRLMGAASSVMLFGETLRKVGVRADFIRIGPHKSAPEQFTQSEMSEESRRRTVALLDDAHRRVLTDLARDLEVSSQRVAELMDQGPHLARLAVERSLVDGAVDEQTIEPDDLEVFGNAKRTKSLPKREELRWGSRAAIGVVVVENDIIDGESTEIPLLNMHSTGGRTIVKELEQMARDPRIRAIVLRVDSPGGAVLASDQIWRAVRRAGQRKPVIASMGAVAASGGYYVACAADEVWADPSTLTGSIGIFYGKVDVEALADKVGVHFEHFKRGKHAGAQSFYRPFTDEERSALAEALRDYYRTFLQRVAEGRGMTVEEVDKVARGRVYSGDRAQQLGLVDRLGGFASALIRARQIAGLPSDAPVVVRPVRRNRLIDFVLGGVAVDLSPPELGAEAEVEVPVELRPLLRMLTAVQQLGQGRALARMPFDLEF